MSSDLKLQGIVEMSSEGAENALNRIGEKADAMASNVVRAADRAGKAADGIGDGATRSAEEFNRAEGKIVASIKRATTQLEQMGKTASQKLEMRISAQGLDPSRFDPMLAKLRELEAAQVRVGVSGKGMGQGLQSTSYQLQDFIVQVNGGTDATKALAMQLPQMLVGFGTAGAAIGVVAALLPNLISLFGNSADSAITFKDAMSDFDKAIGNVGQTVRTFDLDPLYEQFNNSSAAVRAATIEQLKFQQEYIRTTQLISEKKLGESVGKIVNYGFLDKISGNSAVEGLARQLGIATEAATDLMPALVGIKNGTADVNLVSNEFGRVLLKGNGSAIELAATISELAKSDRDAAAASTALSEALGKMAKGHVTTKKEAEEAANASKKAAKESESLAGILDRINGKESGFSPEYVQTVEKLLMAYGKGKLSLEEFNAVFARYVAMQPGAVAAAKAAAQAEEDAARARAAGFAEMVKNTGSLQAQVEKMRLENEEIGLTTEQLDALKLARLDEAIAAKEQALAYAEKNSQSASEIELLREQAAALREVRELTASNQVKTANKRALDEQTKAWENFSRDIERSLTDSLYRAFENGEDAGQALAKSLENTFKTMVLKVAVQAVVNVGAGAVSSLFGGSSGTGGTAGGLGGVGNLFSTGSSLYNSFSGGGMVGNLYNSFATSGLGQTLGLSTAAAAGGMAAIGGIGSGVSLAGSGLGLSAASTGAGLTLGASGGVASAGGAALTGAGSGIATAIPYVGAVLAIAGALGAFDDSDIPQSGGNQAWYLGGSSFDNQQVRDRELSGGMDDEIKSGFDTLSQGLADMLKTIGSSEADVTAYWYHMINNEGKSGTFAARLFAGNPYEQSKAEQEMLYELEGKLKSDGSNFQALMAEAYTGMAKAAIGASDLSDGTKELTTYLLDNGMAVEALTANWESITQWVDSLANLNAQADESAAALVKLAGGLDAFQSVTGTYYATYFSEAEQIEILTGQLQARFDDLGLVMPDVDAAGVSAEALRAEFRGLVEGLDVTTEAGQETFVRLMALAPAFSQVADAVGAVSDASAAAAEQARQAAADLMAVRIGVNVSGFQDLAQSGLSYLQSAADLESQRAQAAQQAAQESINSINSIVSTLSGAAQSLYGNVGSTASYFAAQASAQLDEMLATAQTTGYLPDQDELNTAIQAARAGLSRDNYASTYDYERAQLVLAGKLTQLQEISQAQLPAAEQALNVANSQLTAAQQALDYYQQQVNLLLGIEESSWSLTGSIEEIGDAILESLNNQGKTIADSITTALAAGRIGAADAATQLGGLGYTDTMKNGIAAGSNGAVIAGGNLYATNGWAGSVDAAQRIVAETFGAVSPEDFYTAALGVGLSGRMIEQMYDMPAGTAAAWAKANGLPAFAVGTDYVPQDMLALVHQGESITPAAYRGEQEKLLASLIAEVQALRARLDDVAENTQSTAQAVNGRGRAPMLVESA